MQPREIAAVSPQNQEVLSPSVLYLMTIATGICVANLYYCQPLLHEMQMAFHPSISDVEIGVVPTLTQVGYALGMLFLVPLGDMKERRNLIFIFTLISAAVLLAVAFSTTFTVLTLLSLLLGLCTMTPQFIIPFAAHLAPPEKRGQVLGTVMSGLLLGILLARTVSGFVGAAFGWRALYVGAAVVLIGLAFTLRAMLPKNAPLFKGNYTDLLKSVLQLVKEMPTLREAMAFGFLLFASFSAFWVTLIHLMETEHFKLGARAVGLFGLIGAAGALAAPVVGKFSDRKSPRTIVGIGISVTAFSFLVFWAWGAKSLVALAIGVLLMDIGVQGGHVANSSRVYALRPEARSRVNTAYMFCYFMGGATGSYGASLAWQHFGWPGVCATALFFQAIALFIFAFPKLFSL
jgi:predicted MFS family arabinose efflux permease